MPIDASRDVKWISRTENYTNIPSLMVQREDVARDSFPYFLLPDL